MGGKQRQNRRYTDRIPAYSKQQISRLAFVLAALLIAVTAMSLVFVGYVASQASTDQAIKNERDLFKSALSHQIKRFVSQQLSVSRRDESVRFIVQKFDYDYARDTLSELWSEHGIQRSFLIADNGKVLAESFGDYTHLTNQKLPPDEKLLPLINHARDIYYRNRTRVPGGFNYRSIQSLPESDRAAVSFAMIDKKPAIVAATPITPVQTDIFLTSGGPFILVSAYFLDQGFISTLNEQLNFKDLHFERYLESATGTVRHMVSSHDGDVIGGFVWNSKQQVGSIWRTIIPVIAVLSLALAVLAFGIAWKIGKLTASLQASEQQNRYLALHDTLSGLGNRLQFNRALATAIQTIHEKPFAVLHCDLDKFKAVNDTFGHAAGDEVIKAVAQRMQTVIGRHGLVTRMGGDEFVILLREKLDRPSLRELSDDMLTRINEPIPLPDGSDADIGVSIGIALAPEHGTEAEELLSAADAALYKSKELGRSRMCFADDLIDAADLPLGGKTTSKAHTAA